GVRNAPRDRGRAEPDSAGDRPQADEGHPRAQAFVRAERGVDQAPDDAGAAVFGGHHRDVRRDAVEVESVVMGNWKYFIGASILAAGLVLKAGAPLVPIVLRLAVAA